MTEGLCAAAAAAMSVSFRPISARLARAETPETAPAAEGKEGGFPGISSSPPEEEWGPYLMLRHAYTYSIQAVGQAYKPRTDRDVS